MVGPSSSQISSPGPPKSVFAATLVELAGEVSSERVLLHPDDMLAASINTSEPILISISSGAAANRSAQPSSSSSTSSSTSIFNKISAAQQKFSSLSTSGASANLWAVASETYRCTLPSTAPADPRDAFTVPAIAWPSPKVPRNAVRLSPQLRDSLGRPAHGTALQLHRLAHPSPTEPASSLVLRLLTRQSSPDLPSTVPATPPPPPPTPSASARPSNAKPSSSTATQPRDALPPSSWPLRILQESSPGADSSKPAAKSRALLASLVSRHLSGRLLRPGTFVLIPVFGQDCVFLVEGVQGPGLAVVTGQTECTLLSPTEDFTPPSSTNPDEATNGPASASAASTDRALQALVQRAEEAARDSMKENESGADAAASAAVTALRAGFHSQGLSLASLGGLEPFRRSVQDLVVLPLTRPEVFQRYGVRPPRGVLFHGPPGTGKTFLARAMAGEAGATFFVVNGPDLVSEYYGESESGLRGIFAAARALSPSIIFIDEVDALAPSRDKGGKGSEVSTRLVTALLTLMDGQGISASDRVVVIAATNRPDAIDEALRRPGRFDRELEIGVPSPSQREGILRARLASIQHDLSTDQIVQLAADAHGFVAADLAALVSEASLHALRRHVKAASSLPRLPPDSGSDSPPSSLPIHSTPGSALAPASMPPSEPRVTYADFAEARVLVRPSALREMAVEVPRVRWADVGGLEDVKQRLKEAVELPLKDPESLRKIGAVPPKGILLYGPPGCSKTLLARVVASEAKMNFLAVKGPELFSKWVGESEKAVAALFARARRAAPSIVFFDEIDGLATSRGDGAQADGGGQGVAGRVLGVLLTEMNSLASASDQPVLVLAATNRPDCIDPALLRPGRFDRLVFIPPPDLASRQAILAVHLRKTPLAGDVDLVDLARRTEGYTGAEVASMCREAALAALTESLEALDVAARHFDVALRHVRPAGHLQSGRERALYERFQRSGAAGIFPEPLPLDAAGDAGDRPAPVGGFFTGFTLGMGAGEMGGFTMGEAEGGADVPTPVPWGKQPGTGSGGAGAEGSTTKNMSEALSFTLGQPQ